MDDSKREELAQTSNALRGELKIWEKAFSAANEGKKASREDIKKNVEIGTSLSLYNPLSCLTHLSSCKIQRIQQDPRYSLWEDTITRTSRATADPSKTKTRRTSKPRSFETTANLQDTIKGHFATVGSGSI